MQDVVFRKSLKYYISMGGINLNIAICEDEIEQQQIIVEMLNNLEINEKFLVHKFSSGEELIEAYAKSKRFSIILLDMKMKGIDGIKTARRIREYDLNCIIIIITSIVEYAIEGYHVNAFDFILKPVKKEQLNTILKRAINQIRNKNEKLYVIENRDRKIVIKLSEIIYIESRGRKINVICETDTFLKNNNISSEEKELCNKDFIRISRYYLVNLRYIKEIRSDAIILNNQWLLNLSPKLHKRVYDRFTDYIMEMM